VADAGVGAGGERGYRDWAPSSGVWGQSPPESEDLMHSVLVKAFS